ncbi:uncharacterized protein LOC135828644 isoform X2 [Sycon ciliatum]|uniref:uncharacterized protein LOC135828644 isoform X2 n=1 Tax=Sycon ciliatum TaxID=27933 RepID=UPI0031F68B9C
MPVTRSGRVKMVSASFPMALLVLLGVSAVLLAPRVASSAHDHQGTTAAGSPCTLDPTWHQNSHPLNRRLMAAINITGHVSFDNSSLVLSFTIAPRDFIVYQIQEEELTKLRVMAVVTAQPPGHGQFTECHALGVVYTRSVLAQLQKHKTYAPAGRRVDFGTQMKVAKMSVKFFAGHMLQCQYALGRTQVEKCASPTSSSSETRTAETGHIDDPVHKYACKIGCAAQRLSFAWLGRPQITRTDKTVEGTQQYITFKIKGLTGQHVTTGEGRNRISIGFQKNPVAGKFNVALNASSCHAYQVAGPDSTGVYCRVSCTMSGQRYTVRTVAANMYGEADRWESVNRKR